MTKEFKNWATIYSLDFSKYYCVPRYEGKYREQNWPMENYYLVIHNNNGEKLRLIIQHQCKLALRSGICLEESWEVGSETEFLERFKEILLLEDYKKDFSSILEENIKGE